MIGRHIQAKAIHESCNAEVVILMCGSDANNLFAPTVWVTNKVKHFWNVVTAQNLMDHIKQMEGYVIRAVSGQYRIQLAKIGEDGTHNDSFANFQGLRISIRQRSANFAPNWQKRSEMLFISRKCTSCR